MDIGHRVLDAGSKRVYFDTRSPAGDGAPLEFETDMGLVPEALDMCVRLMTPQERATVTCTSTYAYDGRTDRPQVCPLVDRVWEMGGGRCFAHTDLCTLMDDLGSDS